MSARQDSNGAAQSGLAVGGVEAVAGALRLCAFVGLIALTLALQLALLALPGRGKELYPQQFHRMACAIFGLRIRRHGAAAAGRPSLIVANHTSYLDIPALGSLIPCTFIAKAEVARWPLFGMLAKLQRTVFVERTARAARGQAEALVGRLQARERLVLFAEGTSTAGHYVAPFKSSLFASLERLPDALRERTLVQPVSITATRLSGLPIGHARRPLYSWFGGMELPPHLWDMARAGEIEVGILFHAPIRLTDFPNRKALAAYCEATVASGVSDLLSDRLARHTAAAETVLWSQGEP